MPLPRLCSGQDHSDVGHNPSPSGHNTLDNGEAFVLPKPQTGASVLEGFCQREVMSRERAYVKGPISVPQADHLAL